MDRTCRKSRRSRIPTSTWANWAPDSRHLALIDVGVEGLASLDLLDVDGREHRFARRPTWTSDAVAFRPPDGKETRLPGDRRRGKYGLFAMNADGTDIRPLLEPTVSLDMGQPRPQHGLLARRDTPLLPELRSGSGRPDHGRLLPALGHERGRHRTLIASRPLNQRHGPACPPCRPTAGGSPTGPSSETPATSRSGSRRPMERGPSIGTGPAMSDFFPWSWSPDSSKILMLPGDGSSTSAYLIDPEGGSYDDGPVGVRLRARLAAPGALSIAAPRASAGCSPSERSVGSVVALLATPAAPASLSWSCHRA